MHFNKKNTEHKILLLKEILKVTEKIKSFQGNTLF